VAALFNGLAAIPGPLFLGLYLAVGLLLLAAASLLIRRLDLTGGLPLPAVPERPDPYELAYLRAGGREVRRLLIFDLIERGYLRVADLQKHSVERTTDELDPDLLDTMERCVYARFRQPQEVRSVLQTDGLGDAVDRRCAAWQEQFDGERLLIPGPVRHRARVVAAVAFAALLGVGLAKLSIAVPAGRPSELLQLATVGFAVAFLVVSRPPRLSWLGRAYFQRLRLAYDRASLPVGRPPLDELPSATLLLVALLGFGALSQTPYSEYGALFPSAPGGSRFGWSIEGGDCGAGCGGCGGSGGCGGCGCG
jgi:uncharacterized protein (TIGR04222 family)